MSIDRDRGDYISHIHQNIKGRINEILDEANAAAKASNRRARPITYIYPRAHSFKSLINNMVLIKLLERTGERSPSDLHPERKLNDRTWVRVASGMENSQYWADPMGILAQLVYPNMQRQPKEAAPPPLQRKPTIQKTPPRITRPAPAPKPTEPSLKDEVAGWSSLLEESHKAQSIRRLEARIEDLDNEDRDRVDDINDVVSAIEEYQGIERTGLSPEEYKDEKETAWESIVDAVDSLEITEAEEEAPEEEPAESEAPTPITRPRPAPKLKPEVAEAERKKAIIDLKSQLVEIGQDAEKMATIGVSTDNFNALALKVQSFSDDLHELLPKLNLKPLNNEVALLHAAISILTKERGLTEVKKKTIATARQSARRIYDITGEIDF